ncbi:MAG TPA: HD domain-containing protein [Roseiflexaceae bacterium]|nr:HD domain-containing protein [Roseiflexaceae bacterium]HMP38755.1 HD domain-containing protein [Roseiflexaceae bacterium]
MADHEQIEPVTSPAEAAAEPTERVTLAQVRSHPHVQIYLKSANEHLKLLGYTEHGLRHAGLVGSIASNVLARLGYDAREAELAAIAGLLHDIGNLINREMHGQIGALMARDLLIGLGMPITEVVAIMGAIGNHEEERGHAISPVAAALILADKADVHRSRVHNPNPAAFDIHDRVNYAATRSFLRVNPDEHKIVLEITIDTSIASVMDYFEIFLSRMIMCRRAAEFLGCRFGLEINEYALV